MNGVIENIIKPIEKEVAFFEKELELLLEKQNNFLKKEIIDFIFLNPKRLRPIFILLFSKILKIENKDVVKIALVSELLHNASLIHDDILDEDSLRRGKSTFYKKYGSKIAVLEGDLLLSLALEVLSCLDNRIIKIFSNKIKRTIEGEIFQLNCNEKILGIDEYLLKTFEKTGNLFMAGLESLFVLKEQTQELEDKLLKFMENFSFAFQIQNDIQNFKNKNFSDFKNGNYTLAMIYYLKENEYKEKINEQEIEKYIKKAYKKVEEFKALALESLTGIKKDQYVSALVALCDLI